MEKQGKTLIVAISAGVAIVLATLLLFAPRGSNLTVQAPAPPRDVTPAPLPPPAPSTIAVSAGLPIPEIRQLAESALRNFLRKPIHWKDGATTASINLHPNAMEMTSNSDGTLSAEISLQIRGSARFPVDLWITVLERVGTITGQATVWLTLAPTLHSNWRITAETHADARVHKAEVKTEGLFGFGNTSIRGIFTRLAKEKFLPELEAGITEYVSNIDLKTHVASLWTKLCEPIVVNREPPIILFMAPIEIIAQQLSSDGETLSLNVGIKTYVQANIGDVSADFPWPAEPRTELPDIRFVDSIQSGYHVIAPIQATYAVLETFGRSLVEREHETKSIVLENLTLYGSGTQLAAGVGFSVPFLRAKGHLYLLGTPIFDATTISLSVTELSYSFASRSLLVEIAERIGGDLIFSNLRTTVEEKLAFPIAPLREELSAIIAERDVGPHVRLRGAVDTMRPEGFHLTQTGVHIPFRLQGDVACEINLSALQGQRPTD